MEKYGKIWIKYEYRWLTTLVVYGDLRVGGNFEPAHLAVKRRLKVGVGRGLK